MNFARKYSLLIAVFAFTLTIAACDDSDDSSSVPPEVPPASSLDINFQGLEDGSANKAKPGTNFNTAVISSVTIKAILQSSVAIPRALLDAAQNQAPDQISENEWEWSYSAGANGNSFEVRLTAEVTPELVNWNFFVSADANGVTIQDALLFSGTSNLDGSEGEWNTFNFITNDLLSTVSWQVSELDTSIVLEAFEGGSTDPIGVIEYTFDGTVKTIVFTNNSTGEEITISWNIETGEGFIIAPNFNNGEKSCWGQPGFENVPCPG